MRQLLPVLGLVLGAPVPGGLAILLGTLSPLALAVLMFFSYDLLDPQGLCLSTSRDHQNNWLQVCDSEVVLSAPKSIKK